MSQLQDERPAIEAAAKKHGSIPKILRAHPEWSREFLLRAEEEFKLGLLARSGTGKPLAGIPCPKADIPQPRKKSTPAPAGKDASK